MRPDQLEGALTQGVGDLIAYGLVETTARSQQVAFSIPIQTGVKQIVVTGKDFGPVSSLADLAGKKIFVNPLADLLPRTWKRSTTRYKSKASSRL